MKTWRAKHLITRSKNEAFYMSTILQAGSHFTNRLPNPRQECTKDTKTSLKTTLNCVSQCLVDNWETTQLENDSVVGSGENCQTTGIYESR